MVMEELGPITITSLVTSNGLFSNFCWDVTGTDYLTKGLLLHPIAGQYVPHDSCLEIQSNIMMLLVISGILWISHLSNKVPVGLYHYGVYITYH